MRAPETLKNHQDRIDSGFYDKYMSGKTGLDIGFRSESYPDKSTPVIYNSIGVDIDYPNYDGLVLPFEDDSVDYVYSSHCLEHIDYYNVAIKEWYRVTKYNHYIIIVVPHQFLYEKKKALPSKWNGGHLRFYTPASLLYEIEFSLEPNSYRIESLRDNDKGFDYSLGPEKHSGGSYEIECVIKKIKKPYWSLD